MISCFFLLLIIFTWEQNSRRQPDCLCPLWRFITPTVHSPIYINESGTDREIYEEKHDEIWRKECRVERERGSEVEGGGEGERV